MPWWTVCLLSVNIGTFHLTVQTSISGAYLTISGLRLFHWWDSYFDIPVDFATNVIYYTTGDSAVPPKSLNRLTALFIGQIWTDHIVCKRNATEKSGSEMNVLYEVQQKAINTRKLLWCKFKWKCWAATWVSDALLHFFIICRETLPPATSSIFWGAGQTLCLIGWLIPGLPGSKRDRPRILACNLWHSASASVKVFFFFFFKWTIWRNTKERAFHIHEIKR